MNTNQLKLGSLLSYGQMVLGILIGLFYTPAMIRLLGDSEYGLYNTVASTISMLSILSLGFNSSYIRYYSQYKKQGNQQRIDSLNGLFMLIFIIIGLVAFACGMFLSVNLEMVFSDGLTEGEYRIARVLMMLLSVNLGLSFPMSVFTSIISAHERYVVLKLLAMMKTVVGPLVSLPLLLLGRGSIAMVSVTLVISLTTDLIYFLYVRKKLGCRFVFRNFEQGLFRQLLIFTSFIALNLIVNEVNTNIPKFLLGRFCGTTSVAIYSAGYILYQYYVTFSTSISGVFTPRIHRLVQDHWEQPVKQRQVLTEMFVKVGRLQYAVLALIASGFVMFGKSFMLRWAGADYGDSYYVTLLLMLPATIALTQNVGIEIQRAMNRHKFRSIAYIIMAAINLSLSIVLSQKYGTLGATVGTAISLLVANGLIMNIYYHKKCQIDIVTFWKNILRMSVGMVPALAVGVVCNLYLDLSQTAVLVAGIGLYALVYGAGMWLLGLNGYEKDLIRKPLRKLLGK